MDAAQTVARALGLLELLSSQNLTASQIITRMDMHRSTTYRLLGTLVQLGYIRKDDGNGLYSLSPKILTLASAVQETKDIKATASPFIEELHKACEETIHLAVLDNDELVYLDKRESTKNLRVVMSSKTGSHAPLYCTGIGKVLLAGMPEQELHEYLKTVRFVKYTRHTLPGIQELLNELDLIKEKGYAEDREEHEDGVYCVAAPIRDTSGRTIAALSVSMPLVRAEDLFKRELIENVRSTAGRISDVLR